MTAGLNVTLRNARLNVVRDAIDAGTGPGVMKVYDGTRPATGAAITTQTLLVTCTFSDPSFPDAANGTMTANPITAGNVVADGTATWSRIEDSEGTFVEDLDVGLEGSGADVIVNTNNLVTGGPFAVNSMTMTAGNA